jgi:hypothetical protein
MLHGLMPTPRTSGRRRGSSELGVRAVRLVLVIPPGRTVQRPASAKIDVAVRSSSRSRVVLTGAATWISLRGKFFAPALQSALVAMTHDRSSLGQPCALVAPKCEQGTAYPWVVGRISAGQGDRAHTGMQLELSVEQVLPRPRALRTSETNERFRR